MSTNKVLNEINSLVDKIYEKFLLRDVFAKIVPGFILLTTIVFSITHDLTKTQNLLQFSWLIVIGFSWILGFGVQGIGELTSLIRYYTKDYETDKKWYIAYNKFNSNASSEEKSNCERLVVIKEATGNMAIAFLLSIIIVNISFAITDSPHFKSSISIFGTIIIFTISLILLRMHRVHSRRQCHYVEVVNDQVQGQ